MLVLGTGQDRGATGSWTKLGWTVRADGTVDNAG